MDEIIDRDCVYCKKETKQLFHDAGHERDSSNNSYVCQECGTMYDGWGHVNEWSTPKKKKEDE